MSGIPHANEMSTDENEYEQKESLLNTSIVSTQSTSKLPRFVYALLSLSILLNVILLASSWFGTNHVAQSSYENGFASDLNSVKSEINLIQKTFSGGIELNGEAGFFTNQDENRYTGPPSSQVDEAWDELLLGLNIDLSHDEVELQSSTFRWPETNMYLSGLEVYHSLHCLNRLRQAIYPDHYEYVFSRPDDPSREDHIGHCINHIRQAIQCHADLTPMEWRLDGSKIILRTDTLHTCRDWDKIYAWASSRQTKFDEIKSWKNRSLVLVD